MLPLDQIDLFGAYVAPLAIVMLGCAGAWLFLRQLIDALGLLPYLWHPALFFTALYVILLSVVGLWIGAPVWGPSVWPPLPIPTHLVGAAM